MSEKNLTQNKIIESSENTEEVDPVVAAQIIGVKINTLASWRCTKKETIPFYKITAVPLTRKHIGPIQA